MNIYNLKDHSITLKPFTKVYISVESKEADECDHDIYEGLCKDIPYDIAVKDIRYFGLSKCISL